jgi:hypothetical protein
MATKRNKMTIKMNHLPEKNRKSQKERISINEKLDERDR